MDYGIIEDAFHFVSSAAYGEHSAVISRTTGETYFASVMSNIDEMPEDVGENDDYVDIPYKNDLGLGKPLVMEFVRLRLPEQLDRVHGIFSRRGAYGRFKDFLAEKNLLEEWYKFEDNRTREALAEWCAQSGLEVENLPNPEQYL
ncbi:MAG TPA: UPF0158 family protein [Geobacteraceae bacterium]|nr:UPF0158 family protein [Geobacteraceae bacterium]